MVKIISEHSRSEIERKHAEETQLIRGLIKKCFPKWDVLEEPGVSFHINPPKTREILEVYHSGAIYLYDRSYLKELKAFAKKYENVLGREVTIIIKD